MGQVTVRINEQSYTLACRNGEEERLRELARIVDARARELSARLGQVGEARLMLMVALLLADEAEATQEGGAVPSGALRAIEEATARLEGIVAGLQKT